MELIRIKVVGISLAALTGVLLLAPVARAQQSSSGIAGAVKDAAGKPVAGVKVEASSPALIEKVRTVTTDGQGQYKIINLPIGVYEVTFSAPGFSTVKNVGVDLPAAFTATANAALKAGSPGETITVTAGASLIDTTNTTQVSNTTNDTFENAPTGAKQVTAVGSVTAGLTGSSDSSGEGGVSSNIGGSFHGKTGGGNKTQFDGYRIQNQQGLGNTLYIINTDAVDSVALETGGTTAESIASGFAANMVPKAGSNKFTGSLAGMYTNDKLQSDNLTQTLKDRGLTTGNTLQKQYDIGGTLGGPFKRDKLWFYTAHRHWGTSAQMPGLYYNATQGTPFYTPDLSRPWIRTNSVLTDAIRLTWQASPRNKFRFFVDVQDAPTPGSAGQFNAPEAAASAWEFYPQNLYQATWSSPVTRKLLIEAGFGSSINHWTRLLPGGIDPPTAISIRELSNNFQYNSFASIDSAALLNSAGLGTVHTGDRYSQRFNVSYTTGSHAFKVGIQQEEGIKDSEQIINGSVQYQVRAVGQSPTTTGITKPVPEGISEYAMPYFVKERIKADLGLFVQDLWTLKRMTLNYGLRFDYYNAYVPAQHVAAGLLVGARDFAPVHDVPAFKDLSPRLGAAFDLFGNGKTALKVALGRYVGPADMTIVEQNNPMVTSINQTTRAWNDTSPLPFGSLGNSAPNCDLADPALNGDCGPLQNQNFGKLNTSALTYANDALHGWGLRDYDWDFSVEVQRELTRAVSVSAGYYRSWYNNFVLTDNTAVSPADFNSFCITAPKDARLPGGGGYPVCGMFDIIPTKYGQETDLVTQSSNFGTEKRVNDFFNVTFTTRFKSAIKLGGGVDWGRSLSDDCFAATRPDLTTQFSLLSPRTANANRVFCHEVTPWMANLQVKANASYPLPGDAVVSGIFQNLAGPGILANYQAPNAIIVPALGRSLSGGVKSVTVPIIEPGTLYESRRTTLDVRVTKIFKLGPRLRVQANCDAYNIFNVDSITSRSNGFGAAWGRPTGIQSARLIQFSGKVSF